MIEKPSTDDFAHYQNLIRQVDALADIIIKNNTSHFTCRPGCSSCCQSQLTGNAIESLNMARALTGIKVNPRDDEEKCIFLKEGRCVIYQARPLVCRTQGLPLLYGLADEDNPPELSVCELNFTMVEEISHDSCLNMDRINLALGAVNLQFIRDTGMNDDFWEKRFSFEEIAKGSINY